MNDQRIWGLDDPETGARSAALQKSTILAVYRENGRTRATITTQGQHRIIKFTLALMLLTVLFNIGRYVDNCVLTWSTKGTCANRIDWREIKHREAVLRSADSLGQDNTETATNTPQTKPSTKDTIQTVTASIAWGTVNRPINLRSEPDKNSSIESVLQEGTRIEVLSLSTRGWAEVQTVRATHRGWISQSAVDLDSDSDLDSSINTASDPERTE